MSCSTHGGLGKHVVYTLDGRWSCCPELSDLSGLGSPFSDQATALRSSWPAAQSLPEAALWYLFEGTVQWHLEQNHIRTVHLKFLC